MIYPLTKMTIHAHSNSNEHFIYEGETKMSQSQNDAYKELVGDGLSKVTVNRDLSEKDFGNGGGVSISVTLTCDQSANIVNQAIGLANQIAEYHTWYYYEALRKQLIERGILKG